MDRCSNRGAQKGSKRYIIDKSRNTVFFLCFMAVEGRKYRLAKVAGAEPCGRMRDQKKDAVVARSRFEGQKKIKPEIVNFGS